MGLWTRTTDDRAAARPALLVLLGTIVGVCSSLPAQAQVTPGTYPTLVIDSGNQPVFQTGAVIVNGVTSITAGTGSITLTHGQNRFDGAVSASGSSIALTDADTLLLGVLDAGAGVVSLGSGGIITQNGSVTAGTLNVNGGGVILNSASNAIQVLGDATITGDFTLTNSLALTINSLTADDVSLTVANGVTVGATGVITADQVQVNGNLDFTAGSTFNVVIDPLSSANSLITVTGNVDIDGANVAHIGGAGSFLRTTRVILTTGGTLTGAFTDPTSIYTFLTPRLIYDYDAGMVELELTRNNIDFVSSAESRNQAATANAIDSIGFAAANAVYDAIALLPDDDALIQASFDALSGEVAASTKGALIEDSRFLRNAVNDRLRSVLGAPTTEYVPVMSYAADATPVLLSTDEASPVLWADGFGSWGLTESDGNAAALERSTGGLLAGADGLVGDWRLGVLAGFSHSGLELDDRASSSASDNYHLGLYAGTQWGALALRGGLAYTLHDVSSRRQVALLDDDLSAEYLAASVQAFGELAYGIDANGVRLEPFANLAHVNLTTEGYTEQGGPAALSVEGGSTATSFATLGVRAERQMTLGEIDVTARGMLGWRHAFGDVTPESTQAFSAGDLFTVTGAPIARDSAVIEAGLDLALGSNASLGLSYVGQISADAQDHGAKLNLSASF